MRPTEAGSRKSSSWWSTGRARNRIIPGSRWIRLKAYSGSCFPENGYNRIGLAGYQIFPLPVYQAIQKAAPDADIIKSDEIIFDMRAIKSEAEIEMLREAFRISRVTLEKTLDQMKPEMTELELVGIIQKRTVRQRRRV